MKINISEEWFKEKIKLEEGCQSVEAGCLNTPMDASAKWDKRNQMTPTTEKAREEAETIVGKSTEYSHLQCAELSIVPAKWLKERFAKSLTAKDAEIERLKKELDSIKCRNVINAIQNICEKCGGHKANGKCVECLEVEVESLKAEFASCGCGGRTIVVNGRRGCPNCGN